MKITVKDIITYLLCAIVAFTLAYCIVEYRETSEEKLRQEMMCNMSDARLVRSGMIDCAGVREWKN